MDIYSRVQQSKNETGRSLSILAVVLVLLAHVACRPPQKPKAEGGEWKQALTMVKKESPLLCVPLRRP